MQTAAQAKEQAFRLGLATVLACLLTSALFAAPLLATHFDFNHQHSEGTPPHVHSIDGVLGSAVLSEPVTAAGFYRLVLYVLPQHDFSPRPSFAAQGHNIRAPPHS